MQKFLLTLILPALLALATTTYSTPVQDSLEMAKNLRKQGRIKEAYSLLKKYSHAHPEDLNATWLFAQTAFWAGHVTTSDNTYRKAVRSNPGNYYLALDYAKILTDIGKFREAAGIASNYLKYDPGSMDASLLLGKIGYYRSDYTLARQYLEMVLEKESWNDDARKLLGDICLAKAPKILINGGFATDDQPMVTYTPSAEFHIFLHALSNLGFTLSVPVFQHTSLSREAYWFSAANTSVFPDAHMEVTIGAGLLKVPFKNSINATGNLGISKRFIRHLDLSIQVDHNPYFYTLSSIDTSVMQSHAALSLAWVESKTWTGRLTIEGSNYSWDKNKAYGFNFWGFAPPLKLSVLSFRIGYGFNFSTSKDNHFTSEKSLTEILTNYDSTAAVKGVYNPYFTPKDQQIHSLLASVDIRPSKSIVAGISGSYGIYATASIPYLYLDRDASLQPFVNRDFARDTFHPVEASAFLSARLSENINLKVEYKYHKTYFYTSHYAGFGLSISLCNERKRK